MPWWAEKGNSGQGNITKAAKSPGANWIQIPGTNDSMTQAQAEQVLIQDILHDNPGFNIGPGVTKVTKDVANATGVSSLQGFLGNITSANLWIRVAKVVLGGVILTVGIIELSGQSKNVKGIAGKAVKAAPLLL